MKPEKTNGVETVVLAMPHTHNGEQKKAGDAIDVTPAQKTWLAERGIIQTETQPTGE